MGICDTDRTLSSNQMIFELRRRPERRTLFERDLEACMALYELSEAERIAWRAIDIVKLGQMGVHPYYLPQVTRLFRGAAGNHNDSEAARLYAERMGLRP